MTAHLLGCIPIDPESIRLIQFLLVSAVGPAFVGTWAGAILVIREVPHDS